MQLLVLLAMAESKPYVAAAFICERVLREQDGVHSIVRIVDRFTAPPQPELPPSMKHGLPLTAFVLLKSGDVKGRHPVRMRLHYPSGNEKDLPELTEEFRGDEHGVSYTFQFVLEVKEYRLYWFDVVWDTGNVLTKIPFRLEQGEETPPQS